MIYMTDEQVADAIRSVIGNRDSARVHLYYGTKLDDAYADTHTDEYSAWWVSETDPMCTPETIARMHTGRVIKVTRGDE